MLAPIVARFLFDKNQPGFLTSSIIQSASAQLLCLPILIYSYGEFSILGILANLLISSTISVAMALSLMTGLLSLAGFAFKILAVPAKLLLSAHV